MALSHGVIVKLKDSGSLEGVARTGAVTPIGLIGTASGGTAASLALTLVNSPSEGETLYGQSGGSIPDALKILERYGCSNILVVKVDSPIDPPDIGTALNLFKTARSTLGTAPELIIVPGISDSTTIASMVETSAAIKAIGVVDISAADADAAITARGATGGTGTNNERLVFCFPQLKNEITPANLEWLSTHYVGVYAAAIEQFGSGVSPDNKVLEGVSGTSPVISTGWDLETADTEKLFDAGIVTVNNNGDDWIIWGGRNSLFPDVSSVFSFTNAVRTRDAIAFGLRMISIPWVGLSGSRANAIALSASHNLWLSQNASGLSYVEGSSVLNESLSNFDAASGTITWFYDISVMLSSPVELITLSVEVR